MIGKALSCLVFGVAGTALTASAASPATVAAIAGSLMTGAAGNFFHQIADAEQDRLIAMVFRRNTGIDENHHILHALRLAHLAALEAVLKNYDTAWPTIRNEDQRALSKRFSRELHRFIIEETKSARTGGGISDFEKSVLVDLPDALDTALASRGAHPLSYATNDLGRIRSEIETAVLQEILHETATTLTEVPSLFQTAFMAASPDGWFDLFVRDGAARLKSNEEFRSIWTAEKLARLEVIGKAVLKEFAEIKTDIKSLIASLPTEIMAQIGDHDRLIAELEQVRAKYQQTETLVANFLSLMIGQAVPPDQFAATLYANMERWRAAGDRLGSLERSTYLTPELATLRQLAEVARREERIEDHWRLVEEIDQIEQDDFGRSEKRLREAEGEVKARRDGLIRTKQLKRDTALATLRIVEATKAIVEIIDLETLDHAARANEYNQAWTEWYERGRDKGLNLDLAVAIEIARLSAMSAAKSGSASVALIQLGNTLQVLGRRERGTERLTESVAIYREALEEWTRERKPLQWAMTQSNLGNTLLALGERESGTERLMEAVAAYRAALEECTCEQHPLHWANAKSNLGNALCALGERESGTERLMESVSAYRAALEVWSRERAPAYRALAQNNLGNALRILGEREGGTERLIESVAAHRAALEGYTRESVPLDWARAQNNLGNALLTLGQREASTERLVEAVAVYRAALEERTRERTPLDWATTLNNLGNAFLALAEREGGTDLPMKAAAAFRAALEERTRQRAPLQWAMTQNNLGNALITIGQRENGFERLKEAVAAYRAALEAWTRERGPLQWALTQNNLGYALQILGKQECGMERLVEAVAAHRAALEEWTRERGPLQWAMTQNNLGTALQTLGERQSGTECLIEAVAAYRAALEERTRERTPLLWATTQNNLGNALRALGEREGSIKRLRQAVAAWNSCLKVATSEWPDDLVRDLCSLIDKVQEKIVHRQL